VGRPYTPDTSPDILGLALRVRPFTLRPPLTVARHPGEVPPWDWTRGYSPLWVSTATPEEWEEGLVFTPEPVPPMPYPRLVRAHPRPYPIAPPDLPLYPHVRRLARVAEKHPPDSPEFAQEVVKTAQTVGLLDPEGVGDTLTAWHAFAVEVDTYLGFLREVQGMRTLAEVIAEDYQKRVAERWGFRFDPELGGYVYRGSPLLDYTAHRAFGAANAIRKALQEGDFWAGLAPAEGQEAGVWKVGAYLMGVFWPEVLKGINWAWAAQAARTGGGHLYTVTGSGVWVFWEIGQLFWRSEEVRVCANPRCSIPFLPKRKDQDTCGRAACVKWLQRERAKKGLGPKRQGFRKGTK